MKKIWSSILAAIIGGMIAIAGYVSIFPSSKMTGEQTLEQTAPSSFAQLTSNAVVGDPILDFTVASEKALPAVVHIRATKEVKRAAMDQRNLPDFFRDFFGDRAPMPGQPPQPEGQPYRQQGAGSGVFVSADGYIITNNHVVEEATELEVTTNDHQTFAAEIIGTDPSTDLALIKIEAQDVPFLKFGDSDRVKVGEWVLAVGNPLNLSSTVTAGIVSAKGRNINILKDQAPIESFIQTDAAVNPGNSGGALVNLRGELIGINTAIASPTGSYAGYSFAVPSRIAQKVISDLKEYGVAQRAFLGALVRTMDGALAKELDLSMTHGVYISEVNEGGSAYDAGLQKGDIVTHINGQPTTTASQLIEMVGRHRPGDTLELSLVRQGETKTMRVKLKNKMGTTKVVKRASVQRLEDLGIEIRPLDQTELRDLDLSNGVQVNKLQGGLIQKYTTIKAGFIIVRINNQPVNSAKDIERVLSQVQDGGVMIEGKYPGDRTTSFHAFGLE